MQLIAKNNNGFTVSLLDHSKHVMEAMDKIKQLVDIDADLLKLGAAMHDIGKAHPLFQKYICSEEKNGKIMKGYRHEIGSILFISLSQHKDELIEMIVGHHKSILEDFQNFTGKGIIDLSEGGRYDKYGGMEEFYTQDWEEWSIKAMEILKELGIETKPISKEEAIDNLHYAIDYCNVLIKEKRWSSLKGILVAADHFASALNHKVYKTNVLQVPNLSKYDRPHSKYPLSLISANSEKRHTLVTASCGAGKTDFLFRRCKGRVFYTLPFQSSINSMYDRVKDFLKEQNLNIQILHSTSYLNESSYLQKQIGASIKILTPFQLCNILGGCKGFEKMVLDLRGQDIILDEIHTYNYKAQAIVLKLVEVLVMLDCKIHIGTATMPTILYNRLKEILVDVEEVRLSNTQLDDFDKHIVHKINDFNESLPRIEKAIKDKEKVLIVCNTVKAAQKMFSFVKDFKVKTMLIHSRFKRKDRALKESLLMELNESKECCIVVSTQVVEVSLDINFDLMVTECSPIDSLIQRFGRINRQRDNNSLKDVYVIRPPKDNCLPYHSEVLSKTFALITEGVLKQTYLQGIIDAVYDEMDFIDMEQHSVFKKDGNFSMPVLTCNSSFIQEVLEIESANCIVEEDLTDYIEGDFKSAMGLEIPIHYRSVQKRIEIEYKKKPKMVEDHEYNFDFGLTLKRV